MREDIVSLRTQAVARITEAENASELEQVRAEYLGRNGSLTLLFKNIASLSGHEKRQVGTLINETKSTVERELGRKRQDVSIKPEIDTTLPGIKPQRGHTHLISQTIEEIEQIFHSIGFVRMRYPEIDWDYYAFEALGFDQYHPARDEWETFLVEQKPDPQMGPIVLTPHTSNGQVREMIRRKSPPIRMINIGKAYRRQSDATHYPMFHQFEGLLVDKKISIAHLKGTLDYFVKQFFGEDRVTRIRPYNFPFTEPSFEVDVSCNVCEGAGKMSNEPCKICKEGWLEIGGAGMVHPNVLRHGEIDPKKYSGFAFGWGVERVAMMKPGINIPDIRVLYSTDLRYLTQF